MGEAITITWASVSTITSNFFNTYEDILKKYLLLIPIVVRLKFLSYIAFAACADLDEIDMNITKLLSIKEWLLDNIRCAQYRHLNYKDKLIFNKFYKNDELYLLFVLLHECSHIILNHSDSPSGLSEDEYRSHPVERQADILSIKIISNFTNNFKSNKKITGQDIAKLKYQVSQIH
jgi:hypothetical protein